MAKKKANGGNVTLAEAAAKVEIAEKSALVAIGVPNAKAKPEVFKANTINEAVGNLNVSFKLKTKKLDGSSVKEEIKIDSLDDFEEEQLVNQSKSLKAQKTQMEFLHDFQNELKTNSALREELSEMLQSENKAQLIQFLKAWIQQFKKPEPQLLQLLLPHFSNN